RIGMVDQALAHDGHGLEAAVRMPRKARHRGAVVHAPAVAAAEVLAQIAARERRIRAEHGVGARVGVVMVDAEKKGVDRLPRKAEGLDADDGTVAAHGGSLLLASLVGAVGRPDRRPIRDTSPRWEPDPA